MKFSEVKDPTIKEKVLQFLSHAEDIIDVEIINHKPYNKLQVIYKYNGKIYRSIIPSKRGWKQPAERIKKRLTIYD
jgi:hypothetical protein